MPGRVSAVPVTTSDRDAGQLEYEIYGRPVDWDSSHLCFKCHQRLGHCYELCSRRATNSDQSAREERKRLREEGEARREKMRREGEAEGAVPPRACEKYDLGLCFDQLECKDIHPHSDPAPFGTIKCAIGLPTFARSAKMGPGWVCKKGSGCLYDHEGYNQERVAEAKARWQQRRRANRREANTNR